MEGIDSTWDDLLHESLSLGGGVLGSPESMDGFHSYDIDFVSHLAFADKNRRDYTPTLLKVEPVSPIANFQFHSPISTSSSSPTLSDYILFAPENLRKYSQSTVSSEGTISPKDSLLSSPMIPEPVGYFAKPAVIASSARIDPPAPAPLSPISPKLVTVTQAIAPAASPKDIKPVVPAVPPPATTRRRGTSKATATSKELGKPATTSNQSNAKHMTARDRKRRQMHNASAMRSRIRLNETLDKMWKTIPAARRRKHLMEDFNGQDTMEDIDEDDEERVGRADKVEVGIEYIIYLEKRVKDLEEKVKRGH